ncbi:MAG: hypothetical protein WCK77_07625 [Verrucomicrobiota bacterium]
MFDLADLAAFACSLNGDGTSPITGTTVPLGPIDQILMASALVITPT